MNQDTALLSAELTAHKLVLHALLDMLVAAGTVDPYDLVWRLQRVGRSKAIAHVPPDALQAAQARLGDVVDMIFDDYCDPAPPMA